MVKFKDDEFLGKTVKSTRLYCSIGVEPIKDIFQLRYAGGGNKFSSLCGFMFDTAAEGAEFPRFMISFVCKLRSKIYRQQQHNPSQWFIFRRINKNRVDVLDKKALLVNYGFDIDKFFDSDLFKSSIPKFEKCLKKGITDAETFAKKQKDSTDKQECGRFIKAISDSIPVMTQSKRVNDKYFQLNDLDAIARDASIGVSADTKKKALDAKLDAIHKGAEGSMASAVKYDKKFTANDYIYKKLHGEDEEVDEARNPADFKCKVEKQKEDGEDVWVVNEVDGHWVATFHDEQAAKAFADEYPELKAKYLDKAAKIETEEKEEKPTKEDEEAKLKEKELDADIEESLKEIYS